jgi:hypothetical protein
MIKAILGLVVVSVILLIARVIIRIAAERGKSGLERLARSL